MFTEAKYIVTGYDRVEHLLKEEDFHNLDRAISRYKELRSSDQFHNLQLKIRTEVRLLPYELGVYGPLDG